MLAVLGLLDEELIDNLVIHAARVGMVHAEHAIAMYGFGDAVPVMSGSLLDRGFRNSIFETLAAIESDVRNVRAHIAVPFDLSERSFVHSPFIQVTITKGIASVVVLGDDKEQARERFKAFEAELASVTTPRSEPDVLDVREEPPAIDYANTVEAAKRHLSDDFDKVVLARSLRVVLNDQADPAAVLASMEIREPVCTRFAHTLNGNRFIGASPELLIRRSGTHFASQPLAGTASSRALVEELINSTKDNAEHRIVVEEIVQRLTSLAETLDYSSYPEVMALRSVIHLATRITGTIADPATTSLDLLAAICPTPAVSGRPIDTAMELIRGLETKQRGFFAGAMGWADASGNGAFVLAIRGVIVDQNDIIATAGAGIVADSSAWAEVAETEMKLRSILDAAAPQAAADLL